MKRQVEQFYILLIEQLRSVTLDKDTVHAKERIMPEYAELVYNGYWFSKKRINLRR